MTGPFFMIMMMKNLGPKIVDEGGVTVADVGKTLYIRRKKNDGPHALEALGRRR